MYTDILEITWHYQPVLYVIHLYYGYYHGGLGDTWFMKYISWEDKP